MRTTALLPVLIVAVLGLAAGAARAQSPQSEDEQILKPEAAQAGPEADAGDRPRQSREDDELDDEELDERVFYSGMGIERVGTAFDNLGEATNLAAVMGFRVPTFPWVGLEIDLGQTIIPGSYRDPRPAGAPCGPVPTPGCGQPAEKGAFDANGDELAMQALGLSLAFKTRGRFYATGRYGYRYLQTSNDTLNEVRSDNGFGLGVGYRWGRGLSGVELNYKQLGEDVDSIGLLFFVRTSQR